MIYTNIFTASWKHEKRCNFEKESIKIERFLELSLWILLLLLHLFSKFSYSIALFFPFLAHCYVCLCDWVCFKTKNRQSNFHPLYNKDRTMSEGSLACPCTNSVPEILFYVFLFEVYSKLFFFLGNFLYITCWRVYYNAVVISQFFSCVFARFPRQKKIHQSPHFRYMKKLTSCQLLHFRFCLVYGALRRLLKLYLSDELWEPIHIITRKMKNIF